MRTKKILGFVGAAAIVTFGATAFAGFRSTYVVHVDMTYREAWGSLGATRGTGDNNAMLGCSLNSNGSVCCFAADTLGNNYPECCVSSPTPSMQQAVASLNGDSYLSFNWDTNWSCTYIIVENSSQFMPKPN